MGEKPEFDAIPDHMKPHMKVGDHCFIRVQRHRKKGGAFHVWTRENMEYHQSFGEVTMKISDGGGDSLFHQNEYVIVSTVNSKPAEYYEDDIKCDCVSC